MPGFQMVHRDGLRACRTPGDFAAFVWLCDQADAVGWGNAFDAAGTDLCRASGHGRGWVRSFLRRLVAVGVVAVVEAGDRRNPRRLSMPSPAEKVIHNPDHLDDHLDDHQDTDGKATIDENDSRRDSQPGPPWRPLMDQDETLRSEIEPDSGLSVPSEPHRLPPSEEGSPDPVDADMVSGSGASGGGIRGRAKRIWTHWHDLEVDGKRPHRFAKKLTAPDRKVINAWLTKIDDEPTAIDVIEWAHRCEGSWHRQKGALAFATLFRAKWASDSVEQAARHKHGECECKTGPRPSQSSRGSSSFLDRLKRVSKAAPSTPTTVVVDVEEAAVGIH